MLRTLLSPLRCPASAGPTESCRAGGCRDTDFGPMEPLRRRRQLFQQPPAQAQSPAAIASLPERWDVRQRSRSARGRLAVEIGNTGKVEAYRRTVVAGKTIVSLRRKHTLDVCEWRLLPRDIKEQESFFGLHSTSEFNVSRGR